MIASLAALLLAAAPTSPCAPRGDASDEVRAEACDLLGAIDRVVPDGAWQALGPAADAVLDELARAPDGFAVRRARALEALAARALRQTQGERRSIAERAHRDLAIDPEAPIQVRRSAVRGLSPLLGDDAALTAALAPLAERDRDARVRAAASEVLARRTPAAVCAGLRARASAGGEEAVQLERALAACTAADR